MKQTLESKIDLLGNLFDVKSFLEENNTPKTIKRYYKTNRLAYRLLHNREGFLHMGITSEGPFKKSDLLEPLKQIGEYLQEKDSPKVLELASGHGANTVYLAKTHLGASLTALDLSTLPKKAFYKLNNTTFHFADFHDLSRFENNSFDLIFIIEALCHAYDTNKVISEVQRVLRPKGYFIVFDGYMGKDVKKLDNTARTATKLTATGMAVKKFMYIKDFQKILHTSNFKIIEETDLRSKVLPTMKRFEKLSGRFFRLGALGKLLKRILPDMFVRNAVSGFLMPELIEQGIAVYYKHVLQKE